MMQAGVRRQKEFCSKKEMVVGQTEGGEDERGGKFNGKPEGRKQGYSVLFCLTVPFRSVPFRSVRLFRFIVVHACTRTQWISRSTQVPFQRNKRNEEGPARSNSHALICPNFAPQVSLSFFVERMDEGALSIPTSRRFTKVNRHIDRSKQSGKSKERERPNSEFTLKNPTGHPSICEEAIMNAAAEEEGKKAARRKGKG